MTKRAILVSEDGKTVINADPRILIPGDDKFDFPAASVALVKAGKKDTKGGTIFIDEAIGITGAKAFITAEIGRVVYASPAVTEEQIAALQLLEQYGIPAYFNSDIIL